MTHSRVCVDINSKKIHAMYLQLGYPPIFTDYWIYSEVFLLKYVNIVLFTTEFGLKKGFVDRK